MLSPQLLGILRTYWRLARPRLYLFPGRDEDHPIDPTVLHAACRSAVKAAGLTKRVTLHNALGSFHELTQVPVQSWPLSSLVGGALKDFDLPDCHRLLKARKRLRLVDPWDSQMRPRRRR